MNTSLNFFERKKKNNKTSYFETEQESATFETVEKVKFCQKGA